MVLIKTVQSCVYVYVCVCVCDGLNYTLKRPGVLLSKAALAGVSVLGNH